MWDLAPSHANLMSSRVGVPSNSVISSSCKANENVLHFKISALPFATVRQLDGAPEREGEMNRFEKEEILPCNLCRCLRILRFSMTPLFKRFSHEIYQWTFYHHPTRIRIQYEFSIEVKFNLLYYKYRIIYRVCILVKLSTRPRGIFFFF